MTRLFATLLCTSLLVACGGGGGSSAPTPPPVVVTPPPTPTPTPAPPPPPAPPPTPSGSVTLSGTVAYQRPTANPATAGLDFSNLQTLPIRGARLEAVDGAGNVLAQTLTSLSGTYSVEVDAGTDVLIRVLSQTVDPDGSTAEWNAAITDNTNGNAIYSLQGSLADTGAADQTRDLLATTGADASGNYTGPRTAAPFAILDDTYTSIQTLVAIDPDIALPDVQLRFSVNNRATQGNREIGEIGTSSYVTSADDRAVYILGDAGVDTDEFDSSVIIHEWGHYFEDQVSRSDSIGGPHNLSAVLDKRVALGEGFGNALSGIVQNDPIYRDSSGIRESRGFTFSLEREAPLQGWFSEDSVQTLLFDIADSNQDRGDTLSEGFAPIYRALTDPDYLAFEGFLSIYALADALRRTSPALAGGVDALLSRENIAVTDAFGTGETNSGPAATADALPHYKTLQLGGPEVEVCSNANVGEYNRVGNRDFLLLDLAAARTVTLTMTKTSGFETRAADPDFFLYRGDRLLLIAQSGEPDVETATIALQPGLHVLDSYEFANIDRDDNDVSGDVCFSFTAR